MWTSDIPSIVLTKIKHGFSSKLKIKYPDINFTTSDNISDRSYGQCKSVKSKRSYR